MITFLIIYIASGLIVAATDAHLISMIEQSDHPDKEVVIAELSSYWWHGFIPIFNTPLALFNLYQLLF